MYKKKKIDIKPLHLIRFSGMLLGFPSALVVFIDLQVHYLYWLWSFVACLLWPFVAYWRVKKSVNPVIAERNNLVMDTFFICSFIPLMNFNLLPSVLFLTITMTDKISSSVRRVLLPSFVSALLTIVLFGSFTGFQIALNSELYVIISCFPLLIMHTLSISIMTNRLVRNIKAKNKKLKEYSQKDFLTGLYNKRYWYKKAEEWLAESQENNTDLSLILLDGDHFKEVNDTFGHLVGDDILCEVGKVLLSFQDDSLIVGRLGGDEFAVIIKDGVGGAQQVAKILKNQIGNIRLPEFPELRFSVSLGVVERNKEVELIDFKDFFKKADEALYQAKHEGRGQVVTSG